ncbi:MAG: vWA domain-containing protein [Terrimicrobiaceae bacterium]
MNKNLAEIAFILDRSGSMATVTEAAITGFNEFLTAQQKTEGQARLTLVLFDNEYLVPLDSIPVQEALPLDTTTYVPRASTALLDAIGITIDNLGARLAAMSESERPGQVIVAILTDGFENSSVKFTWQDISRRILEQTNTYNWQFLFLGANQDAIATASKLNISADNASNYHADSIGTVSSAKAISRKMAAIRKSASGMPLNVKEQADAASPLGAIVTEEDAGERKGKSA